MDNIQHNPGVLSSIFGGEPKSATIGFSHPNEEEILVKTIEILQKSDTGAHLLGVLNEKNLGVRVIRNRNAHGYTANFQIIYLGVPPDKAEPDAYAVLELGGAIREIEQELVGFSLPKEGEDPLMAASIRHAKYLDIIVYMCRIAIELGKSLSTTEYVDTIEKLGHGDILRALLAQTGNEHLVSAYAEAHKKVQQ